MAEHKVVEVIDPDAFLEIGRGSFGKVVSVPVGTGASLYTVRVSGSEEAAQPCPCPFARPVLKLCTWRDGHEALQREVDIHHRMNLSPPCARENLLCGMPVSVLDSVFCEATDEGEERWPLNGILMPRMDTNLHKYLKWRTEALTIDAMRDAYLLINQVQAGLKQLHAMNIIHADLSTGNVLVTTTRHADDAAPLSVRISDFGNCRFVGSEMKQFDKSDYVLYMHHTQFTLGNDGRNEKDKDAADHGSCGWASGSCFRQCTASLAGDSSSPEPCSLVDIKVSPVALPVKIKAEVFYDAWSFGIMALDILMQYCRRVDHNIDVWSRQNSGIEVYNMVTQNASQLARRIGYVTRVFAIQQCRDNNERHSQVQTAWMDLINNALCLDPQQHRGSGDIKGFKRNREPRQGPLNAAGPRIQPLSAAP